MQIWLFENAKVTDNWHSYGALMVIAPTQGRVKQLLTAFPAVVLEDDDWENVRKFPTHSYIPEEVFIFPDAGCC